MHYLIKTLSRLLLLAIAVVVFIVSAIVEFIFYFKIPFTKDAYTKFKLYSWKRKERKHVVMFGRNVTKLSYYKNIVHWLLFNVSTKYLVADSFNDN